MSFLCVSFNLPLSLHLFAAHTIRIKKLNRSTIRTSQTNMYHTTAMTDDKKTTSMLTENKKRKLDNMSSKKKKLSSGRHNKRTRKIILPKLSSNIRYGEYKYGEEWITDDLYFRGSWDETDNKLLQYNKEYIVIKSNTFDFEKFMNYIMLKFNKTHMTGSCFDYIKQLYIEWGGGGRNTIKTFKNSHPEYRNKHISYIGVFNEIHHVQCNICNDVNTISQPNESCEDIMKYLLENHDEKKFEKNHNCHRYLQKMETRWQTESTKYVMDRYAVTDYLFYEGKSRDDKYKLKYNNKIAEIACVNDQEFVDFMNYIITKCKEQDMFETGLPFMFMCYLCSVRGITMDVSITTN